MASIDDQGTEIEEFFNNIARNTRLAVPELKATGFCLWCDEPLADGRRFCNAGCRDDHQRANK